MAEKKLFRVGQVVSFQFGIGTVHGTVTEDRGPIGVKGRQLYRIRYEPEGSEEFYIEIPAEELEHASDNPAIE